MGSTQNLLRIVTLCNCLPQWRGETRAETAQGEKNAVRASAVENWSGPSAAVARFLFLLTFFFFSYTLLTSTASAVENLVSPRY